LHFRSPPGERHQPISVFEGSVMLRQTTKRLRDRTVVTAAILSMIQCNAYAVENGPMGGAHTNDRRTASPIKHVIVIMGENRTFDHVFATYEPRGGEHVDNLLSKGIVTKDGTPGPNYAKAAQFSAVDNNFFSINPGQKPPTTPRRTSCRRQEPPTRPRRATPRSNRLPSMARDASPR
jgi:phospholipase C